VSSRREQKDRLRQERLERERADAAASRRRRVLQAGIGGAALVALVVVVVVVAIAAGGGSADAQAGVKATPPPWQPIYDKLQKRDDAMGLPQAADYPYHYHAWLRVYVNGKRVTVPMNIGIDQQNAFLSPLHTHDAAGIVHMESTTKYDFKLGQFFNVWGVKFSDTQLGSYKNGPAGTVQVYVNGKPNADPVNYKMKEHDRIVVAYGKPGSFPKKISTPFPSGL
jgi:hypothetical protein